MIFYERKKMHIFFACHLLTKFLLLFMQTWNTKMLFSIQNLFRLKRKHILAHKRGWNRCQIQVQHDIKKLNAKISQPKSKKPEREKKKWRTTVTNGSWLHRNSYSIWHSIDIRCIAELSLGYSSVWRRHQIAPISEIKM